MKSQHWTLTVALCLALTGGSAGEAFAQAKKGKKAAAKDAKAAAGAAAAGKKKDGERQGPASLREIPKLEDATREAMADKKRDETIENIKRIIPKIEDGSPAKADLLYQLSEFYWEK